MFDDYFGMEIAPHKDEIKYEYDSEIKKETSLDKLNRALSSLQDDIELLRKNKYDNSLFDTEYFDRPIRKDERQIELIKQRIKELGKKTKKGK